MITDEDLVERAVTAVQGGLTGAEMSLLHAIAVTRDEARRHELARQARERAGQLTDIGIELLRIIFKVAVV